MKVTYLLRCLSVLVLLGLTGSIHFNDVVYDLFVGLQVLFMVIGVVVLVTVTLKMDDIRRDPSKHLKDANDEQFDILKPTRMYWVHVFGIIAVINLLVLGHPVLAIIHVALSYSLFNLLRELELVYKDHKGVK